MNRNRPKGARLTIDKGDEGKTGFPTDVTRAIGHPQAKNNNKPLSRSHTLYTKLTQNESWA